MATGEADQNLSRVDRNCGYAKVHPEASVLLCTVPSFSGSSTKVSALTVLYWLHDLHVMVDELCKDFQGLWKFTGTSGNFILASGVVANAANHADVLVSVALKLSEKVKKLELPSGGPAHVHMCIHSGEVASGVIGSKGLQYQVYGPVVDVAHLVSTSCCPGSVKVTEATLKLLTGQLPWKYSGVVKTPAEQVKMFELVVCDGASTNSVHQQPAPGFGVLRCRGPSSRSKDSALAATCSYDPDSCPIRQAWDLAYDNPKMEKYFRRRFHTNQTSLDVTFIVIALLSQGTWIHKWNFASSSLGLVMVGLMLFNLVHLCGITFLRDLYITHREQICVLSHLLHKVSQLLITVSYPHGTVYSDSYNATVALVESSCFAQVMMLGYGLRLRLPVQLLVGLVQVLISFIANSAICKMAWSAAPLAVCVPALGLFQLSACYVLPSSLVYVLEKCARHYFLEAYQP